MKSIITIIGPTCTGKTQLAIQIAQHLNGEIVNADSRQLYKLMDIGTAKPTREELELVTHHLIDIIYPDQAFSLSLYQKLAYECIENILSRNKVPILAGGTGLYVWALLEGWTVPKVPPDNAFRNKMENLAKEEGIEKLFHKLMIVDPIAANKIAPTNIRRVIRALEIFEVTGEPASKFWRKDADAINSLTIGLTAPRDILYAKIDARVDAMIEKGLVDEITNIVANGYALDLPAMSGIGYRQIGMYLQGKISLDEAIIKIKYDTHKFARRQYTWFRLTDSRIKWFNSMDIKIDEITDLAREYLNRSN